MCQRGRNRAPRRSYGSGAVDEILCVSRGWLLGSLAAVGSSGHSLQDQPQAGRCSGQVPVTAWSLKVPSHPQTLSGCECAGSLLPGILQASNNQSVSCSFYGK